MALQASGPISFSQIANEFGTPPGKNLGAYRLTGGQTVNTLTNLALDNEYNSSGIITALMPTSGTIKFSDFYSKQLNIIVSLPSGNRINARDYYTTNNGVTVIGGFTSRPSSSSNKKVWIYVNGAIGSNQQSSTRTYCSLLTGQWDSGTNLRLEIGPSGSIYGAGGAGGAGGNAPAAWGSPAVAGAAGITGTSAIGITNDIIIANRGIISGGQGGGGGGGSASARMLYRVSLNRFITSAYAYTYAAGGGGGGGQGLPGGSGGPAGTGTRASGGFTNGANPTILPGPGGPGSLSVSGAGGGGGRTFRTWSGGNDSISQGGSGAVGGGAGGAGSASGRAGTYTAGGGGAGTDGYGIVISSGVTATLRVNPISRGGSAPNTTPV